MARHLAKRGGDTGEAEFEDVRLRKQAGLLCGIGKLVAGGPRGCPNFIPVLGDDGGGDAVEDRAGIHRLARESDAGQVGFEQAGDGNRVVLCRIAG